MKKAYLIEVIIYSRLNLITAATTKFVYFVMRSINVACIFSTAFYIDRIMHLSTYTQ